MQLITPKILPPLDEDFIPAVLYNHAFQKEVLACREAELLVLALERHNGGIGRLERRLFVADHPRAGENLYFAERLLKFMLWQYGGWKIYIAAPQAVVDHIRDIYSPHGKRAFDYQFMSHEVFQKPFTIVSCKPQEVPPPKETSKAIGRHLEGYRIGFDLGASDLKVSAVVDGQDIFSQETVWQPKIQSDPQYHYDHIMAALGAAAEKMPRLDAIGGSAAGIYIDNRVMVASLFRGVPPERYEEVRNLFYRIQQEMGVTLGVVNDGDVTALAGSMSLGENAVLGIAMGSSEAAGYVNREGNITGWLNELAFAPLDYNPNAPRDEWSQDIGVGSMYFSQQCVFRLAPRVGIQIPADLVDAERLAFVQEKLEAGEPGAVNIWQSIGVYLGYAIAHYADFYDLKHVLVLGRVTSGKGGDIILDHAKRVLETEFPALARSIDVQLPDEKSRRVGQAIAAASLPILP